MDCVTITESIGFKNPVFGEGFLSKGKTYYTYTQFAREAVELGVGRKAEDDKPTPVHFCRSHLGTGKGFRKVLLFFAGGLGDAIMVGAVLPLAATKCDVKIDVCCDRAKWKYVFGPMGVPGAHIPYPPELETVLRYDAVLTDITRFYPSKDGLRSSPVVELCKGFEVDPHTAAPTYRVPDDVRDKWRLPGSNCIRAGMHFESNGLVKSYPERLQSAVLNGLRAAGFEVYVLGGPVRKKDTHDLRGIRDLRGKTTISELAAVLEQMDVVCGVDSFVVHLSNLLKKPTIVMLSTTTPESFEWHKHVSCLPSGLNCAPCLSVHDDCRLGYGQCRAFFDNSMRPEVIIKKIINMVASHLHDEAMRGSRHSGEGVSPDESEANS